MDTKQSNWAIAAAMIAACSAGHIDIVRHILADPRFSLKFTLARCLAAAEGRSFNPFAPAAEFDAAIAFAKLANREIVAALLDAAPPTAADLILIYSAAYGFTSHFKRAMPPAAAIHEFHIQTDDEPDGLVWHDSLISSPGTVEVAMREFQLQTIVEEKKAPSFKCPAELLSQSAEAVAAEVLEFQRKVAFAEKETYVICDDIPGTEEHIAAAIDLSGWPPKCADDIDSIYDTT